ncbi:hypothetical protein EV401DRAFT_1927158 [Pisolithus croceorrhizus]|nr:hypothetical protein EV401DRAFT_1927158 [Pisolithus croceorrhizus]
MNRLPTFRARRQQFAVLRFLATAANSRSTVPQTVIEKVVQKYAVDLPAGRVVRNLFLHSDHDELKQFAREHNCHQVLIEEGYAFPYTLTVASDSHSNMYGGVGCVGTPIVRTDAAALWATGKTWWQVEFKGKLSPGVTGKDVIVALCGSFNKDEVLNAAIEFTGEGVAGLGIDDRLTIANMTTELCWTGMNEPSRNYEFSMFASKSIPPLPEHPRINRRRLDALRAYAVNIRFWGRICFTSRPLISPRSSLMSLARTSVKLKRAYPFRRPILVSCTNSRVSDISAAATVMKGNKVAPDVQFYIAAASSVVQQESERLGDWDALIAAGAKVLPAGCGPCIGLGVGLLEEDETGISATNRNYKGRMGHPKAQAYLASPAVVAASAIKGYICGPDSLDANRLPPTGAPSFHTAHAGSGAVAPATSGTEELLPGFPESFQGAFSSTDALYPGKYTYQDDITLERQAEVVMENYDTSFAGTVSSLFKERSPPSDSPNIKEGVVLISGYNFGTGSSREQAATALKAAGIPAVVAGSFGDIFKRNAINNGLICLESPELVGDLTEMYAKDGRRGAGGKDGELTVNPGHMIRINMRDGNVFVSGPQREKKYKVRPVGASVQELWICGGLEGYILKSIQTQL